MSRSSSFGSGRPGGFGWDTVESCRSIDVSRLHLIPRRLAFETMDAAWPKGRTAIERAEIGREREEALYAQTIPAGAIRK